MTTQNSGVPDPSAAAVGAATGGYATFPVTTTFAFPEYEIERTLGSCFGLSCAPWARCTVSARRSSPS